MITLSIGGFAVVAFFLLAAGAGIGIGVMIMAYSGKTQDED